MMNTKEQPIESQFVILRPERHPNGKRFLPDDFRLEYPVAIWVYLPPVDDDLLRLLYRPCKGPFFQVAQRTIDEYKQKLNMPFPNYRVSICACRGHLIE